jgi:hypothetical protein
MNKSGKPFDLRPVSPISPIGYNAPTLADLIHQRTRAKTITSRSKLAKAKATPLAATTSLIKALKVITLFISTYADTNYININHQGVRAATRSSSAIPPTSSTTTFNQPSEVFL